MKNKILKIFYSSFLYKLYLDFLLSRSERHLELEIESAWNALTGSDVYYQQDSIQHKYQEGILALKKEARSKAGGNLDAYLKKVSDLFSLATDNSPEEVRLKEALRKFYVNGPVDIPNEKAKVQMIDQRIGHYYELQKYKLKREELKKQREKANGKNT